MQKEFLNAWAGTEGKILSCWNQWAFWQCQDFSEGLHGSVPQGAAVSWTHPKSLPDIWSRTTTPMGSQQKIQRSAENGLLSSLVLSTPRSWYSWEIPFCPPLVLLPFVPSRSCQKLLLKTRRWHWFLCCYFSPRCGVPAAANCDENVWPFNPGLDG